MQVRWKCSLSRHHLLAIVLAVVTIGCLLSIGHRMYAIQKATECIEKENPAYCFVSLKETTEALKKQKTELVKYQQMDPAKRWDKLEKFFNDIWSESRDRVRVWTFHSGDEPKWFIDFVHSRSSCNIITIGVGKDITAEKMISRRYPQCSFLGADPDGEANRPMYLTLPKSRFVRTAVAGKSGTYQGSFLQPNSLTLYKQETRYHMAFANFFEDYNHGKLIDLLIMDNEGGEFTIFDVMNEKADKLPVICQMNIEIHYNPPDYNVSFAQFFQSFDRFILSSQYIVLNIEGGGHHRVHFMNIIDEICVQKFLC